MTTAQPPRRRHSPAVYRRRRLVLLLGVVAVVAIVWLLIAQPWQGFAAQGEATPPDSEDTSSQAAATELPVPEELTSTVGEEEPEDAAVSPDDAVSTPTGTPAPTPAAAKCLAADLTVEAVTDQATYATGQNPQLSIRLTNEGETDCALNVGTTTQVFTIMSGSDTWWRSTDCQSAPSDMVVLLAAGQTVSSAAPLTWDRTRSAVGTCENPDRPRAPGGGASYHLSVEIGGVSSTESAQILLY